MTTVDAYIAFREVEAKANEIGVPMGIAVTDAHGDVCGFIKIDGAFVQDASLSNVYSTVSLHQPTDVLPPSGAHELGFITQGRLTNLTGKIPIAIDSVIIGVVGEVGNEDEVVARAGVESVVKKKKR